MKQEIVGAHVSLWNPGLLLLRLVLAGFDCSEASVLVYGYNISVVLTKKTIDANDLAGLSHDRGDLLMLKRFLPDGINYRPIDRDVSFDGRIRRLNW